MQAAFQGESNAQAKYLAFAAKADEEGYAGVASLFRAAAAAEGIHAENHAEVIRQLGAKAVATIAEVKVATTRENLETAISGESYEWDVMYPGMINRARRDRERAAIRSFNFAMTAERSHATFYRAALADMDSWKSKRDFFVCGVCGETVAQLDFTKCPSCFSPVKEYRKVN
jgi:rubrerythrin